MLGLAFAADSADLMTNGMPDAPAFPSNTYSGYIDVSDTKSLHYVFAESINDPTNKPVTIWFNGGPGCSSMLGFLQENGPVVVDDGETTWKTNPYPWNQNMNMLWIESPAGVGWSIAASLDNTTNDLLQSQDALAALRSWYKKFPEYLPNELFISGESYAGIYVPFLAWQVSINNSEVGSNPDAVAMNLKGFMVGNGATNWEFDVEPSFPQTVRWFNIITPALLKQYEDNNCHDYFYPGYYPTTPTQTCVDLWNEINSFSANLNWYDLYRPVYDSAILAKQKALKADRTGHTMIDGVHRTYKKGYTMHEYTPWAKHLRATEDPPILGDFLSDYMNREDVRTAFHIPSTVQTWDMCNEQLDYHEQHFASQWIYEELKGSVRKLFYSGDTDGAVSTYGSKRWIMDLNWATTKKWTPWYTQEQCSGFYQQYDGLDFVTVKGVGHMAPQWARQAVLQMVDNFVTGSPY